MACCLHCFSIAALLCCGLVLQRAEQKQFITLQTLSESSHLLACGEAYKSGLEEATDTSSPVSWEVGPAPPNSGSDSFVQHIPQMPDWIETWGIQRSSQHLKLIVVLFKPLLNHFCFVAGVLAC